jgi:hypothetical protein
MARLGQRCHQILLGMIVTTGLWIVDQYDSHALLVKSVPQIIRVKPI